MSNLGKLGLRFHITDKLNSPSKSNLLYIIFVFVSLFSSIFPRLPFMHHISSNWRSSQTLLTSYWFQKEGISLFHAQLPVYGPPWEVPFEFPIYQAISTGFSNITHLNLTASSRVVSVAFFYASAIFLLLLCVEFLDDKVLSSIIFWVYLWLPYNIRFSTEILIDYTSVALALGYIFWIKKYLDSPGNFLLFILAILFGSLGAMIKITTMPIVIIPAILITANGIQTWGVKSEDLTAPKELFAKISKRKLSFLLLAAIAILPILSAGLWTKFADTIKRSNIFTLWLTSTNLTVWNFGRLDQKTSFTNWWNWLTKIDNYFFLGGILLLFLLLAIAFLYRMPLKSRCFFGAAFASVILTIFIFFNLYLHEYYYIAVSAYMSVLVGFGIYCLIKFLLPNKMWWIAFSGIFLFFIWLRGIEQYRTFQAEIQAEANYEEKVIIPLAKKVARMTPENQYIISFQSLWYPDFMLFAQRKGLIISPAEYSKYSCELIKKYDYSTIVVVDSPPETPGLLGIFNCFASVRKIGPYIYKVRP